MATEGALGQQHRLPQQGAGMIVWQLHQPAADAVIWRGNAQVGEALQLGHRQVEIERAGRQAALTQDPGEADQLLQQRQLILEGLEGSGKGARLGFALGQGCQALGCDDRQRFDLAEAEAVME
jgi:hypothetical protein